MRRVILFFFIFLIKQLKRAYADNECHAPLRCNETSGPDIEFPFRLKDKQPQYCGYPSPWFDLICKDGETMFASPSFEEFSVLDISYNGRQSMTIMARNICTVDSSSKLHTNLRKYRGSREFFYQMRGNYTLLSCTANVDFQIMDRPLCTSASGQNVYLVKSSFDLADLPQSCNNIGTFTVPFDFLAYGPKFRLDWYVRGCRDCRGKCGFNNINASMNQHYQCLYEANLDEPSNQFLPYTKGPGASRKPIIIGTSIGFFFVVAAIIISIWFYRSWKLSRLKERENQLKVEKFLDDYESLKPKRYSYADIKKMTDQLKCKLGEGGYGSVFKGMLPSGSLVAVKILKEFTGDGEDFINEVGTLGRIHHVNVVRLLGYCADRYKRALIYEFMSNESLEKFIFLKDTKNSLLGWEKLQDIAVGVATGIEYLHQGCDQRILHFDIKPQNVLLDHNFNSKISDFGLAKLCTKSQSIVSMTATRGTMGYIAPEVFSRNFGNVSYKSDVYSFGMLLLEMVGGRKNVDATVENVSQIYFPEWIYNHLHQGDDLGLEFDNEGDAKIAKKLAIIATWCIQWYPGSRPSMKSVIQMLKEDVDSLTMPPNPFASTTIQDADTTSLKESHDPKLAVIVE